jgi:molybdenum cofactor cytidylyltransferase
VSVAGILLAAGASTRLGYPKQLLKVGDKSLVFRAAQTLLATGCQPIVVVVGFQADRISVEIEDLPITSVHNPDWRTGMASSIAAGLSAALRLNPNSAGVLITLCDQPRVTGEDLRALIALYGRAGKPIAAAAYNETLGVPAVFDRSLFSELMALKGEQGARKVIAARVEDAATLAMPQAAFDVDTTADLDAAGINPDVFA